jgi:hypothetical protein
MNIIGTIDTDTNGDPVFLDKIAPRTVDQRRVGYICLTLATRAPMLSPFAVTMGFALASLGRRPTQAAICRATAITDFDFFM